jgi:AcrR family transcriptional regulator
MRQASHLSAYHSRDPTKPSSDPVKTRAAVPETPPAESRRERTRRLLISEAMRLAADGNVASVAEVASAAGVSRATAYRYFPSHSRLVNEIVQESLGPVRGFESREVDGAARVRDLFEATFPRFRDFEPQLRAALQLALEHWALGRSGLLREEPFRRGFRKTILTRTAAPLLPRLGRKPHQRLLKALSLVYGIEPYVVLKDIWGSSNREVDDIARWVADAVIEKSLRESEAPPAAPPKAPRARRART